MSIILEYMAAGSSVPKDPSHKTNLVLVAFVCLILGFMIEYRFAIKTTQTKQIRSYEECVAAGNPILETYPAQCRTPDGKMFTQDITKIVPPVVETGVVCTMEVKECPDGSYVGRNGPKCEFTRCPRGE